jgi:hypothetical protein
MLRCVNVEHYKIILLKTIIIQIFKPYIHRVYSAHAVNKLMANFRLVFKRRRSLKLLCIPKTIPTVVLSFYVRYRDRFSPFIHNRF